MLLAFLYRWWHCLLGTFGKHRMETWWRGWNPMWIGCECGRCFYESPTVKHFTDADNADMDGNPVDASGR